ncbi:MAG: hypothetical protein DMF90_11240 [Acidobacteria bacterium]|nr:MAG: hypothetical protein DMF90_11240 [Acidobacteriota bacterium]
MRSSSPRTAGSKSPSDDHPPFPSNHHAVWPGAHRGRRGPLAVSSRLPYQPGPFVIVDVDERSLASVGQWPWRRDVMGQLIDRLRMAGAAVVALDVMFPERDRYEAAGDTPDDALAAALRGGRVILGYAMTFDGQHYGPRTCVQHPLAVAIVHPAYDQSGDPFFHATGGVCNLEGLSDAAGRSGFLNAAPDGDGILRRVPMLVEFDGRVFPSLALAAVTATARRWC